MREFGLTQNLLNRALEIANSRPIVRIHLLIGAFSEDRENSIRFYWKDLAKGSLGENAELHFEHVKIEMKCLDCTGAFYLDENYEECMCRFCCGEHLNFLRGEDVRLESVEVK